MKTRLTAPPAALITALAARLLFGFVLTSWHTSDAAEYMSQGHALLRGHWISAHANGYPVIVALVELAVGRHLETALLVLNVVCSTAIVELVARFARLLGAEQASVTAAAWAAALWPNQLVQSQNIGSDIPAAFFLALGILVLGSATTAGQHWRAGLAAGAGAACRSAVLPAIAAVVLVLARRRSPRVTAAFLSAAALPLVCLVGLSAAHDAGWTNEGDLGAVLAEADASFGGAIVAPVAEVTPAEGVSIYFRRLRQEPFYFVRQRAAALWELWGSWPYDNGRGLTRQIAVALRFPLLALAAVGWYTRRHTTTAACLAASIVAMTLAQTMLYALVRYLVPMEPLAIALASSAPQIRRALHPEIALWNGVGRGRTDTPCGTGF